MPKEFTNIASTSHAQAQEFAALAGVSSQPQDTTELQNALRDALAHVVEQDAALRSANEQVDSLTAELAAEKEAHAATQAALTAATTVQPAA